MIAVGDLVRSPNGRVGRVFVIEERYPGKGLMARLKWVTVRQESDSGWTYVKNLRPVAEHVNTN